LFCLEKSEVNWKARDCRGECIIQKFGLRQTFYSLDECHFCHLSSTKRSPFLDCNNQCKPPGLLSYCNETFETNTTPHNNAKM